MKLVLILPGNDFLDDEYFVPSLGLLHVEASLRQYFDNIKIIPWVDLFNNKDLLFDNQTVIGITGANVHEKYIAELPKLVSDNVKKIVGGPLATVAPQRLLSYGYNVVISGEIEGIEEKIVEAISDPSPRVLYQESNIQKRHNAIRHNLDFSKVENFFPLKKRIGLMTSRGCVYNCAFCAKTTSNLCLYSIIDFTRQLEIVIDSYNPKHFIFYDDNILVRPNRFLELAKAIKPFQISWRSQARANFATEKSIQFAIESGCKQLSFGVESGSQKILDNVNKGLRVDQNTKAITLCKSFGLMTKAFIMIGLPGETKETLKETKDWLLSNRPDIVSLYIYLPFEGSHIYNNISSYDLFFTDKSKGYYAGTNNNSPCSIATSALSSQDILQAREDLRSILISSGITVY